MKLSFKTVVLFILIGLPVLTYIFLKIFGNNKFDLPYYFPKLDRLGEVVLINRTDTVYSKAPEFRLVDQNGNIFTSQDLKGKTYLVNYFFTRCSSICPVLNQNIDKVLSKTKLKNLETISISADPKHDSPEVLSAYAKQFENNKQRHFLTGDKNYIYNLGISGFKLPVSDAKDYDSSVLKVDDQFIHSEKILLIDSLGFFRGIFDGTNPAEIDRLEVELDILRLNQNERK